MNAITFALQSGSNKLGLFARDESIREGILVDVVANQTSPGRRMNLRSSERLVLLSNPEFNDRGRFFVGRSLVIHDDDQSSSSDRIVDLLIQIKTELDRHFLMMGTSGKTRLITNLSSQFSFFQGLEQTLINSTDLSQIRTSIVAAMRLPSHRIEKTTFMLLYILDFFGEDMRLLVHAKNTIRRLESIRAKILSTRSVLRLNPHDPGTTSILRGNSVNSGLLILFIVLLGLLLKGSGYIDGGSSRNHRW